MPTRVKLRVGWSPRHWIILRQIIQYTALLIFVALFIALRRSAWPASVINIPLRLDPLVMLAHLLANSIILAGSVLAFLTVGLTLIFGRVWCGWLCPLGTILDLFSLRRWRGKRAAPPESWRTLKYGLLITLLVAAFLGNLTLLIFDPLTLLFRTLSISIWPALDQLVTALETWLYQVSWLRPAVATFDGWVRPAVLPSLAGDRCLHEHARHLQDCLRTYRGGGTLGRLSRTFPEERDRLLWHKDTCQRDDTGGGGWYYRAACMLYKK